jgi:L,D-transpeptidase catalytic domain
MRFLPEPSQPDPTTIEARGRQPGGLAFALVTCGLVLVLVAAALYSVRLSWPAVRVQSGGPALARVRIAPFGERISSSALVLRSGHWVKASIRSGVVRPAYELAAGSRVKLELTVQRASWIGWLVGSTERVGTVLETPAAHPSARLVYPAYGGAVKVAFSAPVAAVAIRLGSGPLEVLRFAGSRRVVPLGILASGETTAGTALVSGAPRLWERIPPPVSISWFPAAPAAEVFVRPQPRTAITPTTPLVLTFSRPLSSVLGSRRPALSPRTPGTWYEPNDHTLVFRPTGFGFRLGSAVHLRLTRALRDVSGTDPANVRTFSWRIPAGSALRLDEVLAQLDYLPLSWRPAEEGLANSAGADADAALAPPAGTFGWRNRAPQALRQLWSSQATRAVLQRGAIMTFESVHGMSTNGVASPALWRVLLRAERAGKTSPYGYSYVFVTESLPETLTLWHDGRVVLRTPVNTGIPGRDTALGTYPVYLHLASTTMSGTNPDGTHYSDPDVPWVNYFNGGDAVHGFIRPGYGYPQSLGCVEAPVPTAAVIWPYVHVGTLVTVDA